MNKRQVDPWGRAIYDGKDAVELLLRGCDVSSFLMTPDEETTRYNQLCEARNKRQYQISPPTPPDETPDATIERQRGTWLIPEEYHTLAVREELLSRCQRAAESERVNAEMDMFEQRGWLPVLRLMFYLVDDFRARGVVWGVGRGSSVASYCLYLIGIHKCDSLYYDLDIREFLK